MFEKKRYNIVLITYQYSVVVKGIERNLTELEHHVIVAEPDLDIVRQNILKESVFIVYLSKDILGKKTDVDNLMELTDYLSKRNKNMIVIGEKAFYDDFIQAVPLLKQMIWLNRPVEMEAISKAIETAMAAPKQEEEKKRILIVDDDPSYAKMVREWLKDTYQVSIVTAGMQAITFLMKNKVDLILLDYEMPIIDGPQILEMLKSEPSTVNIPVVFLTGVGTRESIERVMALKPSGYVLKSATKEALLRYVTGLLEKLQP